MTDETQVTPDASIETPEAAPETKVHPAHEKLLAELPEVLHSKVTPYLQEQDKFFQQQLEKYTPFKDFVDQGISPDIIQNGINLANAIQNDPVEVFSSLQSYLQEQGMLASEAKKAAKDIMESESGDDFENLFDDEEVPAALKKELDSLRESQAKLEEYTNNQIMERETAKELEVLEAGIADLRSKYTINDAHEVAIYNLMNSALAAGMELSVAEAAGQLSQMIGGFAPVGSVQSAAPAPTIIGSAGGAGVQAQQVELPKSDKERRAMLGQMFEEYRKANQ
jgi:hypothetical protein